MAYVLGVLLVGVLLGAVYLIRGAARDAVALEQSEAILEAEKARNAAHETAAERERAERTKDFDARAASVTGAADAGALLRDQLSGFNTH